MSELKEATKELAKSFVQLQEALQNLKNCFSTEEIKQILDEIDQKEKKEQEQFRRRSKKNHNAYWSITRYHT